MKKAGDLLQNFLDENIMNKAKEYSGIFSSWASIAGDQCAAHSRISDLKGTLLIVEADHPGWIQILQTRQAELLKSIQKRNSKLTITGISFRLTKESNQSQSENLQKINQNIETVSEDDTENLQEQIDATNLYDKIHDEDFKESLKKLEESIKMRNKK
jgi:predicted nucleic acid-binding Zn ribbon protein